MLRWPLSEFSPRWLASGVAAVIWALAAGLAVLWGLHLPRALPAPDTTAQAQAPQATVDRAALARALGQTTAVAAAPDVQKRFALLGVIATGSGRGSALLAVDGQPAQAFVQGQAVTEGWQLEAVRAEGVRLAPAQGSQGQPIELALPVKP
jgi:general secretion pathway protein C